MKTIHVQLTEESIDAAIAELEKFKKWIEDGTQKLLQLMGEKGVEYATIEYGEALYTGVNDVSVSWEKDGSNRVAVRADGQSVLFIEFGTGIRNQESHPDPLASSYPHGEYGYGLGGRPGGWRYPEEYGEGNAGLAWPDEKHPGYLHTLGNPANASLYNAMVKVEDEYLALAKEAFGTYA